MTSSPSAVTLPARLDVVIWAVAVVIIIIIAAIRKAIFFCINFV